MHKLTNKEEEIMKVLWKLEKAFVKEILEKIKGDKPHYNTLSTIVRNLQEKGYVDHEAFGNTHRYYPLVTSLLTLITSTASKCKSSKQPQMQLQWQ